MASILAQPHLSQMPTFPSPIDSNGFVVALPGTPWIETTRTGFFLKWPFGKVALWLFALFIVAVIVVTIDITDTNVIVAGVFPPIFASKTEETPDAIETEPMSKDYTVERSKRSTGSSQTILLLNKFNTLTDVVERALKNQQCYQRFICEIKATTRLLPGFDNFLSYSSLAKFFLSPGMGRALDKLSEKETCNKYLCGP